MKFGFDINGVINAKPKLFANITQMLVRDGHEVHIITSFGSSIQNSLKNWGIAWTHFFSITDSLYSKPFNKWFEDSLDSAKAKYCAEQEIDLHIDDSEVYEKYFTTPYLRFKSYE